MGLLDVAAPAGAHGQGRRGAAGSAAAGDIDDAGVGRGTRISATVACESADLDPLTVPQLLAGERIEARNLAGQAEHHLVLGVFAFDKNGGAPACPDVLRTPNFLAGLAVEPDQRAAL